MITDISLNTETTVNFAEHEVLLSFNEDHHREVFEDWWQSEGLKLFEEFYEETKENY